MKKLAFFDTKPYDRESFDRLNAGRYDIRFFGSPTAPQRIDITGALW